MYYAQLSPKQKRIIERDIETLYKPGALLGNSKLEEIKKLDVFHPTVKIRAWALVSFRGGAKRGQTNRRCSLYSARVQWLRVPKRN
jgi:hypothetical protein